MTVTFHCPPPDSGAESAGRSQRQDAGQSAAPLGHSRIAHELIGYCLDCRGHDGVTEAAGWRVLHLTGRRPTPDQFVRHGDTPPRPGT